MVLRGLFGLIVFLASAAAASLLFSGFRSSPAAALVLLAIVLAFAAAGIGLMIMGWKSVGIARDQRLRERRHPASPWLWREDWEQGFAKAEGFSDARFRMAAVPGVLGGRLRGCVETSIAAPAGARME